jgi:hypothetical protein
MMLSINPIDGSSGRHDRRPVAFRLSLAGQRRRTAIRQGKTIADTLPGASRRHLARTIVGVRVGLMTRHRFGCLFSKFRTDAPCAARHCDGKQSSRGGGAQSALANTNPRHDHAGNAFKPARRWMWSRMS